MKAGAAAGGAIAVKICGITRVEDGLAAARAGANAVGFVFAPSSRHVSPERARAIARALPPSVWRVGVFVDAPVDEMAAIAEHVGLDAIQLHGGEGPETVEAVRARTRCRIIKAVRLRGPDDGERLRPYGADVLLADTYHPSLAGGTGTPFPWEWAAALARRSPCPLWLAGGLGPDNVRDALARARPAGVDVSSGVEAAPGVKDAERVRRFIQEVRRFEGAADNGAAS